MGYYNSFVVKIWIDDQGGKFRGHVQHVSSQDSTHFIDPTKMWEFIANHLTPPTTPEVEDKNLKRLKDMAFRESNDG